jgi:hypothetical protein
VLGGVVAGAGLYVLAKKAKASGSPSACESACVAAMQARGVTGDLSGICKTGCGLLSDPLGAVKGVNNVIQGVTNGLTKALGFGIGGGGVHEVGCECPNGWTSKDPSQVNGGAQIIRDQRNASNGSVSVYGRVCVDAGGNIKGTQDDACNFHPYVPPKVSVPPPIVPQPSITSTTTNTAGGTNTQRDHRTP